MCNNHGSLGRERLRDKCVTIGDGRGSVVRTNLRIRLYRHLHTDEREGGSSSSGTALGVFLALLFAGWAVAGAYYFVKYYWWGPSKNER
eukprot:985251-Pyramimonas_sp.AAC.2